MRINGSTPYSPQLVDLFFKRLAEVGKTKIVCERLGLNPNTPTYWKKKHPEFAKRWKEFKKA